VGQAGWRGPVGVLEADDVGCLLVEEADVVVDALLAAVEDGTVDALDALPLAELVELATFEVGLGFGALVQPAIVTRARTAAPVASSQVPELARISHAAWRNLIGIRADASSTRTCRI
jgi:hypothetical protein